MMRLRRELQVLLIMVCGLVLVGCNDEELYANLTEQEANEIVALMYAADMPAEKRVDKDETFTVTTSKNAFPEAMALLQSQGLPREQFDSLGEVFQKEGFVSSPLEERARLNHALSQEISRTIASIDGVVQARVHLAVPEKQQLEKNTAPSSASVFVKHRPDVNLGMNVGKIKAMVINSVEGSALRQCHGCIVSTGTVQASRPPGAGRLRGQPVSRRWRAAWPAGADGAGRSDTGRCGALAFLAAQEGATMSEAMKRGTITLRDRRRYRGEAARRLATLIPADARAAYDGLDWPTLETLPHWCLVGDHERAHLQRVAGALFLAPLWHECIDGQTLRAIRQLVGAVTFDRIRAESVPTQPCDDTLELAGDVDRMLMQAGAGVLQGTLPGLLQPLFAELVGEPSCELQQATADRLFRRAATLILQVQEECTELLPEDAAA